MYACPSPGSPIGFKKWAARFDLSDLPVVNLIPHLLHAGRPPGGPLEADEEKAYKYMRIHIINDCISRRSGPVTRSALDFLRSRYMIFFF